MMHTILETAYSAPRTTPREAPKYSLNQRVCGRVRHKGSARLTKQDVEEIRRWARAEGFLLGTWEQARVMAAAFGVSQATARDVIVNQSFYDPSYDRTVPLSEEFVRATAALAGRKAWLLWVLLLWRMLCASSVGSDGSSPSTPICISD
jgi:hypothetical protein